MGVDYSANFGIGVRIHQTDFEEDHEWYDDFLGFLETVLADTDYEYFEVGDYDEQGDLYICIENPFENGFCGAEEKAQHLVQFLKMNEIEFYGEVDLVGGLNIW